MSIVDGNRLPVEYFQIDAERLREGKYSDAYFLNTRTILSFCAIDSDYSFEGLSDVLLPNAINNGDLIVEQQFFTRRQPKSLIAGVDEAIALLKVGTGYWNSNGTFVNTYDQLEVEAVHDGTFAYYEGNPMEVQPVLKVRGRYRDFAALETPILGSLTEMTRIATNVYHVLEAANGKDVLFFPARFAHYKVQAAHGYAYSIAVLVYNQNQKKNSRLSVSTDEQGRWWGGGGVGTIAHSTIASFMGDTAETLMQFSKIIPPKIPRIALVDFHNDCCGEALKVMKPMFFNYWALYRAGFLDQARRYKLFGVRADTSGNMRDASVSFTGDEKNDNGVCPQLVWNLRKTLDEAYLNWELPQEALDIARTWCQNIKIVVTGGFNIRKITDFEQAGVPVDIYGVGSSLLENSNGTGTNNDFTADIVRVKIGNEWQRLGKLGRQPGGNPDLKIVY